MYKILIVTALSQELKAVKNQVQNKSLPNISLKGEGIGKLDISYFSTGVGNYNMILHLSRFLENNHFDFVINIGVCGYVKEKFDFFQVGRIFNLANVKELIIPKILNFGEIKSIACSEKIIFDSEVLGEEDFVDMESYGFEMVCDAFSLPRIILKIPVDRVGQETKNFDFSKAKTYLEENIDYEKLLEQVQKYLEKNKKEAPEFERYFSNWNFTFSQKIIFQKLFFRYRSLVEQDFETYFFEHKGKEKKEFLKQLEEFLGEYVVR